MSHHDLITSKIPEALAGVVEQVAEMIADRVVERLADPEVPDHERLGHSPEVVA